MEQEKYKDRWIAAFAANATGDKIRKAAGIGKDRYYRLRDDPEFQRLVRERRDGVIKSAVMQMEGEIEKDLRTLQTIIEDEEVNSQTRLLALKLKFSTFTAWREHTDILSRLEALEATQDATGTF